MPSLSADDVRDLLPDEQFTDRQIEVATGIVRGWLLGATGLTGLPDPLSEELWSAATELIGLLASNPASLASETAGPTSRSWPMAPRRDAIIRDLRTTFRGKPQGAFPPPPVYPDPATAPFGALPYERWVVR